MSFERFWSAYPRKVARGAATKAWEKLNPDEGLSEKIILAVDAQKRHRRKVEEQNEKLPERQRRFLPDWKHPGTWINQQCWLDEIPSSQDIRRIIDKAKCQCGSEAVTTVHGKNVCTKCYDNEIHPDFKAKVYKNLCDNGLGKMKTETPSEYLKRMKEIGIKEASSVIRKKVSV